MYQTQELCLVHSVVKAGTVFGTQCWQHGYFYQTNIWGKCNNMNHLVEVLEIVEEDLSSMMEWNMEDVESDLDLIPHFVNCLEHALMLRAEHQSLSLEFMKDEGLKKQYILEIEIQILSLFTSKFFDVHYDKLNFKGLHAFYKTLSKLAEDHGWPQHLFNKTIIFAMDIPELLITRDVYKLGSVQAAGDYYN